MRPDRGACRADPSTVPLTKEERREARLTEVERRLFEVPA